MRRAARRTDPVTSHLSAVDTLGRATQRDRLLIAYYLSGGALRDEDAAHIAGVNLRSCWWKRCSELREQGLIEVHATAFGTALLTRSSLGRLVRQCRITPAGHDYLRTKELL